MKNGLGFLQKPSNTCADKPRKGAAVSAGSLFALAQSAGAAGVAGSTLAATGAAGVAAGSAAGAFADVSKDRFVNLSLLVPYRSHPWEVIFRTYSARKKLQRQYN